MGKTYKFIRVPMPIFEDIEKTQKAMEERLFEKYGKKFKLKLPSVFKAIFSRDYRSNVIYIEDHKLFKLTKKNKKGQIFDNPLLILSGIFILLFLMSFIFLTFFMKAQAPLASVIGNVTNEKTQQSYLFTTNTAINFWDTAMVFLFLGFLFILTIFSFFLDNHPVFWVIYVLMGILIILTIPEVTNSLGVISNSTALAQESAKLEGMEWIRSNFGGILAGTFFLNGIIIFAKFSMKRQEGAL